jgi:subtilisin-like proprotein convertase family protein
LTYSGGTSAGTATAEVTYTVAGSTPVTATYNVSVNVVMGIPDQFSSTPGLSVVSSAFDNIGVVGVGTIFDLNVMLDIPHSFTSDMDITLTSASNTSVLIVSNVGGSSDDILVDIILNDGSPALSTAVTGGQSFGLFSPTNSLSTFIGEDANGTWSLDIADVSSAYDDGCLRAWSLIFNNAVFADPGQFECP